MPLAVVTTTGEPHREGKAKKLHGHGTALHITKLKDLVIWHVLATLPPNLSLLNVILENSFIRPIEQEVIGLRIPKGIPVGVVRFACNSIALP